MKRFIPVNQKGGVGKTTTGYNFAHYVAEWPSPIDTDTSVRRILDFQTVLG